MNKIDTTKWGRFVVGELFDIHPTKAYKMNNSILRENNGCNEVIVNSSFNNGVGGYTNQPNTEKGNIITFSDTTSSDSIFYHKKPFVGYPHVQGMHPIGKYKDCWNQYSYLFFVTVFKNRAIDLNYNYVNKFTREAASRMVLKLPINSTNELDFQFMEAYIKRLKSKMSKSIINIFNNKYVQKEFDTSSWKRFHLYDIFEIDAGTKLDKIAMRFDNPTINFVGRSSINNGVTSCVDEIKNYKPYSAGNLTLALGGAYLGACFVQEKPFYTSQNVVILIPKFDMSFNTKQFIATIIFKEGQTHYKAFVDELNRHIKTDFSICLPVKKNGCINYEYIDTFMKSVKENAISHFKAFDAIKGNRNIINL